MHHQGQFMFIKLSLPRILIHFQSVFLGDITSAYQKKPELESLLFDDFFNKG